MEAEANPFLGVLLHSIGGLCSAVFYLPYLRVRGWAWESYWIVGGVFSWIVMPALLAGIMVDGLPDILSGVSATQFWSCFAFGALWGVGGLMFGLTVRYLGVALGVAMALGYCAAFGTLMPPIFAGEFGEVTGSFAGRVVLVGVGVCLAGIVINGWAGWSRDRDLPEEKKREVVQEFNFGKGVVVATICGIFSACMSYGFAAGKPIAAAAVEAGTPSLWSNLPVLVIVLWGGFTTNFIWCMGLNLKNRTWVNYLGRWRTEKVDEVASEDGHSPVEEAAAASGAAHPVSEENKSVPILANLLFAACAGSIWYFQFFFYSMGTSRMGKYEFSSWTLHMASIMIFGTVCGILLKEWRGVSRRTWVWVYAGLAVLVASTLIVGYGNYTAVQSP